MKDVKVFLTMFFVILLAKIGEVHAADIQGCLLDSDNRIYPNSITAPPGMSNFLFFDRSVSYHVFYGPTNQYSCGDVTNPSYVQTGAPAYGNCKVKNANGTYEDGHGVFKGPLNTTVNCPMDDYIPILVLCSAGLGFFFLRKRRVLD